MGVLGKITRNGRVVTGRGSLKSKKRRPVGNARRFLGYAADRRHGCGPDDPLLVSEIDSVPEPSIYRLRLRQVVIAQTKVDGQPRSHLPFILKIPRPGPILVLYRARARDRQFTTHAAWQAQ